MHVYMHLAFNDESELESPIESDTDSNLSDAEVDYELNANGDGSEERRMMQPWLPTLQRPQPLFGPSLN